MGILISKENLFSGSDTIFVDVDYPITNQIIIVCFDQENHSRLQICQHITGLSRVGCNITNVDLTSK